MDPRILVALLPAIITACIPLAPCLFRAIRRASNNTVLLKNIEALCVNSAVAGVGLGTYLSIKGGVFRLILFALAWLFVWLGTATKLGQRARRLEHEQRTQAWNVLL